MAAKYGNVNFKKHGTRETRDGDSAIGSPSRCSLPGPVDPSAGARSKVMTKARAKETLLLVCLCVLLLAVSITKVLCILGTIAHEESIHSLTEKISRIEQLQGNLTSELQQSQQHVKQLQEEKDNLTNDLQTLKEKAVHCAVGWTFYSGSCYYFSTDEETWTASRDACISEGGHLVIITSSEERAFLSSKSGMEKYWIGLTDAVVENDWRWLDGKKLSERPRLWTGKEPDNWTGEKNKYPEGEDCAVLDLAPANNGVIDTFCSARIHKRICEAKAAM